MLTNIQTRSQQSVKSKHIAYSNLKKKFGITPSDQIFTLGHRNGCQIRAEQLKESLFSIVLELLRYSFPKSHKNMHV